MMGVYDTDYGNGITGVYLLIYKVVYICTDFSMLNNKKKIEQLTKMEIASIAVKRITLNKTNRTTQ